MTTKKEHSRRYFDRWAPSYGSDWRSRLNAEIQHRALEALELTARDRLLDVGCGTGAAVLDSAPRIERAVGVDLSPAMIARARELAAAAGADAELREGDAEALPFADGEFTAVLCTTSLHHYPDPARALAEMARVLQPGGRVVVADGCRDRRLVRVVDAVLRRVQRSHVGLMTSAELAERFAAAGLRPDPPRLLHGGAFVVARAARA